MKEDRVLVEVSTLLEILAATASDPRSRHVFSVSTLLEILDERQPLRQDVARLTVSTLLEILGGYVVHRPRGVVLWRFNPS